MTIRSTPGGINTGKSALLRTSRQSLSNANRRSQASISLSANSQRSCVLKKRADHSRFTPPNTSHTGTPTRPKIPRDTFIPRNGVGSHVANFAKKFAQQLGPADILYATQLSTAHMPRAKGQYFTSIGQAASLGLSIYQQTQTGATLQDSLVEHAPDIFNTAIETGVSLHSLHRQNSAMEASSARPNELYSNQNAWKNQYLQNRLAELENFNQRMEEASSLEIDL